MPSGISCQLTRIIYGTVLVEYTLGILLFPSTILQLSAHYKFRSAFNNSFVAILSIDESKNGPCRLDHLGLVMLGVFASYARLRDTQPDADRQIGTTHHVSFTPSTIFHLVSNQKVTSSSHLVRVGAGLTRYAKGFKCKHSGIGETNTPIYSHALIPYPPPVFISYHEPYHEPSGRWIS